MIAPVQCLISGVGAATPYHPRLLFFLGGVLVTAIVLIGNWRARK